MNHPQSILIYGAKKSDAHIFNGIYSRRESRNFMPHWQKETKCEDEHVWLSCSAGRWQVHDLNRDWKLWNEDAKDSRDASFRVAEADVRTREDVSEIPKGTLGVLIKTSDDGKGKPCILFDGFQNGLIEFPGFEMLENVTQAPQARVWLNAGSLGHPDACGKACKYIRKNRGCIAGKDCVFCHVHQWKPDNKNAREGRSRRKPKAALDTKIAPSPGVPEESIVRPYKVIWDAGTGIPVLLTNEEEKAEEENPHSFNDLPQTPRKRADSNCPETQVLQTPSPSPAYIWRFNNTPCVVYEVDPFPVYCVHSPPSTPSTEYQTPPQSQSLPRDGRTDSGHKWTDSDFIYF
mmetsp:Transcript_58360/g.90807  ORF Transcript_58360/g.90807 Transcript_58360/m.90807 type:complete len:347 (-) Transcript_58360:138-1178(-)